MDELVEVPAYLSDEGQNKELVDIPAYLSGSDSGEVIDVPAFLGGDAPAEDAAALEACAPIRCETACQVLCERSCMTNCEAGGCETTCQLSCQACQGASCQTCQVCEICQTVCEKSSCMTECESICQSNCERSCMATCETSCQNCQGQTCQLCMTTCEKICQKCEGAACQTCQNCEGASCQTCQNCEGAACQTCQACQGAACQTCQNCQGSACQSACQTSCEISGQAPTAYGSISVGKVTATTITITLAAISRATSYTVYWRKASDSSSTTINTVNRTVTLTGLTPDTAYVFNYHGVNDYGYGPNMPSLATATTLPGAGLWSWTSSNGSATDAQTQTAYAVCMGTAPADQFSHLVWNDLVDKVAATLKALNKSWSGSVTQDGCKVSAGDFLTAAKYNALRANVDALEATGIDSVSRDSEELTGYHIIQLTDALNAAIDKLINGQ